MDLKKKYSKEVIPGMIKRFNYKNKLAVPKIEKITINAGLGRAVTEKNPKYVEIVEETISKITGQRPVKNPAKKSIAGFKIRAGMTVGLQTTLRGERMYNFMGKLINIALPRIRDFRGLNEKSVDQQGNLSIGFKEQIVFPEIAPENVERTHGLQAVITTTAKNHKEGLELFKLFGFLFTP